MRLSRARIGRFHFDPVLLIVSYQFIVDRLCDGGIRIIASGYKNDR